MMLNFDPQHGCLLDAVRRRCTGLGLVVLGACRARSHLGRRNRVLDPPRG
jgi:hypothetical protein